MRHVNTIIRNGKVCTSRELFEADIAIAEEKIVAIGQAGRFQKADEIIDAKGKYIIPGLWHTHCHFRDPGMTHKEDFESGHRCAAAGGFTFTVDQTNTKPYPCNLTNWNVKREEAQKKCIVDYNHYAAALTVEEIPKLAGTGTIGFKMFNTQHPKQQYPYISDLAIIDHGLMYELYEAIAKTGLTVSVHHDDSDWVKRMVEKDYILKGKTSSKDLQEAYERGIMYGHGMVMGLAVSLYIAKLTGVKLYVLHAGMEKDYDIELVRHARSLGQTVYTELEMAPFVIDKKKAEKYGPYAVPWGKDPNVAFDLIKCGWADVVLIEHAPHTIEEIEPGWENIWDIPLGLMGMQEFLPMMLTYVNQGHISLNDLVRVTSENPARIFGFYPVKGAIQVGSDADLTILDMNKEQIFTKDMVLSKSGWTVFDGDLFTGWPIRTIVRGHTVMKDGEITGQPGKGKFISRKITDLQ